MKRQKTDTASDGAGHRELDQLVPGVYDELCGLASGYLRRERRDHTLQTAALVHEAYLRMVGARRLEWNDRSHFLVIAARMMRRILVDHERGHGSSKRGGGSLRVSLDEARDQPGGIVTDVARLDEALQRLAEMDRELAQLVELRFFGGLSHDEAGEVLGLSRRTALRRWRTARAWLHDQLKDAAA